VSTGQGTGLDTGLDKARLHRIGLGRNTYRWLVLDRLIPRKVQVGWCSQPAAARSGGKATSQKPPTPARE
jgi:hypothetical protein